MSELPEAERLSVQLTNAVQGRDLAELNAAAWSIDRFVFDSEEFSGRLFATILSVCRSSDFLRLPDSVPLLKVLEYNLKLLSDRQRMELLAVLTESIPSLADEVSAFLAVELVAELYADKRSFEALFKLTEGGSEKTLAMAVHGFEWLAKRTVDRSIRAQCLDRLKMLSTHSSRVVATEASQALARRSRSE